MKLRNRVKTTSASSATTLPHSAQPLHATKKLLIDVDNLTVRLGGEPAVQAVSLCLHAGEFLGLIGPNGAGKTTLLRAILGLQKTETGKVARATKQIGYVPQRGNLYAGQVPLSVLEVVRLGGSKAASLEALKIVQMESFIERPFGQLSGGQQQRVAIAKALASDPEVLLLDEPTTGIDEQAQSVFYDLLRKLQQRGIAIVMVSHDVEAVLRLVTRVVCLNRTVLYDGPPEHFEADKYLPGFYRQQHRFLHHHHGEPHA